MPVLFGRRDVRFIVSGLTLRSQQDNPRWRHGQSSCPSCNMRVRPFLSSLLFSNGQVPHVQQSNSVTQVVRTLHPRRPEFGR